MQHITVRDASRKAVKVSASIGADGTSIIVRPPAGGYQPGMAYTVRVKSTLRSQSGKRLLGKPITKRFKIAVDVGDGNAALPVVGSFKKLKQLLADSAALRPNPMMRGGIVVTTGEEGNSGEIRPSYRDSAVGGEWIPLDYSDIRYFPNSIDANYLLIAGLNLEHPEETAKISTVLGAVCSGQPLSLQAVRGGCGSPIGLLRRCGLRADGRL